MCARRMREVVCLHYRRPYQYVIGHKWHVSVPNHVATAPGVQRVVTLRLARIGSVSAGECAAGRESGGHENDAKRGLRRRHGGEGHRSHRRRHQIPRGQGRPDGDNHGKQG